MRPEESRPTRPELARRARIEEDEKAAEKAERKALEKRVTELEKQVATLKAQSEQKRTER